jgi:hypothetical protein
MTPTNLLTPSDPQVGKLHERLLAAARKSGVSPAQFQLALGFPGTDLEDEIAASIVKFSKRASGIVTPVRAQDTGLIPEGWTVESDSPEGDVNLAKLDFTVCPVRDGDGDWVGGETMLKRAVEVKAIGSLGFGKMVIDAQKEGKDIIPVELRGKVYIILPRTILLVRDRYRRVAYFYWSDKAAEWVMSFYYVGYSFNRDDRFVRPRE